VAVIDGPYDAAALSGILARAPVNLGSGSCCVKPSTACNHGTLVMGLLGARRDAVIPGLCPECQLFHVPLFLEEDAPWASVGELANAITVAVAAGARLINLSLAILGDETPNHRELVAALDYAEANGTVILVAAGNQGRLSMGQLLSHPATVPVVAVDATGSPLPACNFGPAISRRGVAAFGQQILGYAPGGGTTIMSGTSVATAVATGTLAQLWAARPNADGADIRAVVMQLSPRNGPLPPMLERNVFLMALDRTLSATVAGRSPAEHNKPNYASLQGETIMNVGNRLRRSSNGGVGPTATCGQAVIPASDSGSCACGAPGGVCTCAGNQDANSGFVYAIGTVEAECPNMAIERELQSLGDYLGVKANPDKDMPLKPTEDRSWQHGVLSKDRKMTRYIARQLSWRLTIEDLPAFVLKPQDPSDFDELIDCLARPKYRKLIGGKARKGTRGKSIPIESPFGPPQDLDVVVGVRGAATADGIEVLVDQIYTIPPGRLAPEGLGFFAQLSDNYGMTDADRAYNFLAARYEIGKKYLDEIKELGLVGVPIMSSRLSGEGSRLVKVIFTLRGTKTPVEKKYFVRVDVTHKFPMIVSPWQQYLERGELS